MKTDRRKFKAIPGGTRLVGFRSTNLGYYWRANGAIYAQLTEGVAQRFEDEQAAQAWLLRETAAHRMAFA